MSEAEITAVTALREATGALTAGVKAQSSSRATDPSGAPELAFAVTQHLDAMVALLRTAGVVPSPPTGVERSLHAVAQQLERAGDLARESAASAVPHYSADLADPPTPPA